MPQPARRVRLLAAGALLSALALGVVVTIALSEEDRAAGVPTPASWPVLSDPSDLFPSTTTTTARTTAPTTTPTTAPSTTTTTTSTTTTTTATTVATTTIRPKPTTTTRRPKLAPAPASEGAAVFAIVNDERADAGCGPLKWDDTLATSARLHSVDMAEQDYFDHTSLDGRSPFERMKAQGYARPGGENIAAGQRTPESVMESWMNSPGHRANILNCDYRTLGVGIGKGGGYGIYWTQNFGF